MPKNAAKHTQEQPNAVYTLDTAMRRQLVSSLRLQGKNPQQILDLLTSNGCLNPKTGEPWSITTISEDLRALTVEWGKSARVATQEHIAETLAKLREVERAAWDRGDLDSVLKAVDKEMKLLGLNAPQTISITTKDRAKELAELIGTTPEELIQVAKRLAEGEAP